MKKLGVIILTCALVFNYGDTVHAQEQLEIYDDEIEQVIYDNKVQLVFYDNSNTDMYNETTAIHIENVQIELYYMYNNELVLFTDIEEYSDISLDLTSNESGIITLENLPYGLYEYKIVSAPEGYEYSTELVYFQLSTMNSNVERYIGMSIPYVLNEIEDAEIVVEEEEQDDVVVEEPIQIEETSVASEEVEAEQENTEEEVVTISNISVNTLAVDLYSTIDEEEQTDIMKISDRMLKKANNQRLDMIEALNYLSIQMMQKVQIIDGDEKVHYITNLMDLPVDNDKKYKIKITTIQKAMIKKYREYKNTVYTGINRFTQKVA